MCLISACLSIDDHFRLARTAKLYHTIGQQAASFTSHISVRRHSHDVLKRLAGVCQSLMFSPVIADCTLCGGAAYHVRPLSLRVGYVLTTSLVSCCSLLTELDMQAIYADARLVLHVFQALGRCQAPLRSLRIHFQCSRFRGADIKALAPFRLQKLVATHVPLVAAVQHFASSLTWLDLLDGLQPSDADLQRLQSCRHLRTLRVDARLLTQTGCTHLGALRLLTDLELFMARGISDEGFALLRGLPLTRLAIPGAHLLTSAGLAFVSAMPLTSLNLSSLETTFCDQGFVHLAGLRQLAILTLSACNGITGVGLKSLCSVPIEELNLSLCDQLLPDVVVQELSQFAKLRRLDVRWTAFRKSTQFAGLGVPVVLACPMVVF